MIKLTVKNCDGIKVDYIFLDAKEFMSKMDSDSETDIPMLDDKIVNLEINNKHITDRMIVNDLYNDILSKLI